MERKVPRGVCPEISQTGILGREGKNYGGNMMKTMGGGKE